MSALMDLLKVLWEPGPVFERVREKPSFWWPFLGLCVIQIVIFVLQMPFTKAMMQARKSLVTVSLKQDTLFYAVKGRHGTTRVYMQPASDGTGVIAGGAMRAVFDVVGVTNILAKCHGSTNPYNIVRATLNALENCNAPAEIAAKRGLTVEQLTEA